MKKTLSIFFICWGIVASESADALDLGVVKFTEGDIGIWESTGSTRSAHVNAIAAPHPTSILVNHDKVGWLEGNSRFYIPAGEVGVRGNVRFDLPLIKKTAIFDNEDFCTGDPSTTFASNPLPPMFDCGELTRFSFTQSDGKMDEGLYWHLDFDFIVLPTRDNILFAGPTDFNFRAFYGFARSQETFIYRGYTALVDLTASPDEIGRSYPTDGPFITHEIEWGYQRFGLQAGFSRKKSNRIRRLSLTAVTIPSGNLSLDDSHHLRSSFGPVPNVLNRASDVSGHEYEIEYSYVSRFNETQEIYISYRLRHLEAEGYTTIGPDFTISDPTGFESNRSGLLIGYRVRF